MAKGKRNSEIQGLRSQLEKAIEKKNYKVASDLNVQLAESLRRLDCREESLEEYENGLEFARLGGVRADEILALRAIAEIKSETGDEGCMEFLKQFEELVKDDPMEYQLMLTVGCYCLIKLYSNDEKMEQILDTARKYGERSLAMIDLLDKDKKMAEGDSIQIRTINCHRYLAEIAGYQGNKQEGERHTQAAFEHAVGRKESQFEILRTRIDFSWRDKVVAAEHLCKMADESLRGKRVEAYLFLAVALFERQEFSRAKRTLFDIYTEANVTKKSIVSEEDKKKYSDLLVFAYRVEERLKQLLKCTEEKDLLGQYRIHDKLADLYNDVGFKNAALEHYRESLKLADTQKKKRSALISCAETASELKKYKEAAGYFDRVKKVEEDMGKDISETLVAIFEMRLLDGDFHSDVEVQMEIDRLERRGKLLNVVYSAAATYYSNKGNKEEAERYRKNEKHFLKTNPHVETIDDEEGEGSEDSLDEQNEQDILEKMRKRAAAHAKAKALVKGKGKKNHCGESKLIERAREGTLEEVKILVQQGANVNEADPLGWTPLSEAVGANNLDIVKFLLQKGANPNSQSRDGWCGHDFAGKITPLMEACADGRHEIANWLLNHPKANELVVTMNKDGWSAADFMTHFISIAQRGDESEAEFQAHLAKCRGVLEKIKQLQRKNGFPVREGPPPMPERKSDDTKQWSNEKKRTAAKRPQGKKGAAEDYKEAITSIGSRSKQADKEQKKKKEVEDDLFGSSDDEPLVVSSTSSAAKKKKQRAILSSDSEDDQDDDREKENEKRNRRRKSIDMDDPNFGLEVDERPTSSQSRSSGGGGGGTQAKKLSGVQRLLQKAKGGQKRSMERGDENGVSIVPDDFEIIEERHEPKRRKRNDSEGSQSEGGVTVLHHHQPLSSGRRDSIGSTTRDWQEMGSGGRGGGGSATASPATPLTRAPSHTSLSSASALATTWVRVIIERPGAEPEQPMMSKVPSDAVVSDLPRHFEKARRSIDGAACVWTFRGDELAESLTLGDLAELTVPDEKTGQRVVEVHCRVRKTLKAEMEKRADPSDRDSLSSLTAALAQLEAPGAPTLDLSGGGGKYSEKTRTALWQVIEEYVREKRAEDSKWRIASVHIDKFDVPASALRALIRMRPREGLSLRHCGLDDAKVEEMVEELCSRVNEDDSRLNLLDLSFNDLIASSEGLARLATAFQGVHTIILQGLSGIEEGEALMKALRGLPLNCLNLNENPWLDDGCMTELLKGGEEEGGGGGRLSTLKTLQISKCVIRTMSWLAGGAEALSSLKTLSLAENNGVTASGWDRVAGFIRSSAVSLTSLDVRGTSVRTVILEALAARSSDAPVLTVALSRCNGITPAEIIRVLSPLVEVGDGHRGGVLNLKLQLEKEKVEEVRNTSATLAAKTLKVAPDALK